MKGWTLFKDTVIQSRRRDGLAGALAAAEAWPDLQWPSVVVEVPDLGGAQWCEWGQQPLSSFLDPSEPKRALPEGGEKRVIVATCTPVPPHPPFDT